jgi:hypothetical protein
MAWTLWVLGGWYGLAAVVVVLGLVAERGEQGESVRSAIRAATPRLRARSRALSSTAARVPPAAE